jgi:hypothetical protein
MTELADLELVETDILPYDESDSNDKLTHIINPAMNGHIQRGVPMTAAEILFAARMENSEVIALCGHRFVPKHNPEKYDICQPCMDEANAIIKQDG